MTYQLCIAQPTPQAETWHDASTLGIQSLTRTRLHAGTDTLTLTLRGPSILTDDPLWNFNQVIRLRSYDGTDYTYLFLGRVQPFQRSATGAEQTVTIEVRGIWDWFEHTTMRQQWLAADQSLTYAPHVILYLAADGSRATTGAQLTQAINTAISAGCPVQIGSIPVGYTPPLDEQINISVADTIVKCLANHPHACLWIDYSTRTPTLNVATRQSLPAASIPLVNLAEELHITSREDLQPPRVAIAYIRENSDTPDGTTYIQTTIDKYPPAADPYALDTLWGVFDLHGATAQYLTQKIKTQPIDWNTNKNSAAWWKSHIPSLATATISSISNPSGQYSYPNFLTEGSLADWMHVDHALETFTALATLTRSNSAGIAEKKIEKITFQAITTNATTKTYRTQLSFDTGEIPPQNLAQAMYAEWSQLHYDGQITLAAQDVPTHIGPGQTLNITGARPAWATMAAMIIQVTENFHTGRTDIQFGVPPWIDLDSRMAWIRSCRTRRFATSRTLQSGADPSGTSGGEIFPSIIPAAEPTVYLRQRFVDPSATPRHEIDLNPADISGDSAQVLKPRLIQIVIDDNGTLKAQKVIALCSAPYGDTSDLGGGGHFDLRYDSATKQLQKQTEPEGSWTMISGGQFVEETV